MMILIMVIKMMRVIEIDLNNGYDYDNKMIIVITPLKNQPQARLCFSFYNKYITIITNI